MGLLFLVRLNEKIRLQRAEKKMNISDCFLNFSVIGSLV